MRSARITAYPSIIAWSTSPAGGLLRRKSSARRVTRQELIIARSSVDAFSPMHSSNKWEASSETFNPVKCACHDFPKVIRNYRSFPQFPWSRLCLNFGRAMSLERGNTRIGSGDLLFEFVHWILNFGSGHFQCLKGWGWAWCADDLCFAQGGVIDWRNEGDVTARVGASRRWRGFPGFPGSP